MKTKKLTFEEYSALQSKRFQFANSLSVCEGTESYAPKYSLMSLYNAAHGDKSKFVKMVDESIVDKLHFMIDTTDKAQLAKWFDAQAGVDEADMQIVDEATTRYLKMLASKHGAEVSMYNGCIVIESENPTIVAHVIDEAAEADANIANALKASLVDEDFLCRASVVCKD